jgi:hypothetical protein
MHHLKLSCVIPVAILFLLFAYPFIFLPFGADQGIFAYIGTIINNGGMPYRDAWDLKPPVVYYLYSLGLQLFGDSMLGLRLFDFLYFGITIFSMYLLGALLFCKRVGLCSGLLLGILYFFTNNFWTLSQCESFMILPMILSVYCCCAGLKKYKRPMLFGAGVFLGVVFMTKLTGIVLLVPLVIYILLETYRRDGTWNFAQRASRILVLIAGFIFSTAILFLWFYAHGALSELIDTLFVYDAAHFRSAFTLDRGYSHFTFAGFMRRYLFVLIPALLSLCITRGKKDRLENILLWSWFISVIIGFFIQGRFYPYHMLPVIAPLSLLGGYAVLNLWYSSAWSGNALFAWRKGGLLVIVSVFLLAAIWPHIQLTYHFTRSLAERESTETYYNRFFSFPGLFSFTATIDAAQYIKNKTAREDTILVWGFQPLVYFLSERQAPTRFFFSAPLLAPFNIKKNAWRRELLADIQKRPPKYIIVVEQDTFPNMLMANINTDSRAALNGFPDFLLYLKKYYAIEYKTGNFILYHCQERMIQ